MALSLGFHIVFAAIGVAMPFFMAVSHWRWLKTGNEAYLILTKAWSKGVAIFFATGAVSGTVLSFELGLLWPEFMRHAGPIIGMPFSWEGAAFFFEAIALGLFLYGWNRLPPWSHWICGVLVGVSGVLSALFVMCANAWMNNPVGFDFVEGRYVNIDPVAAMFNEASLPMGIHMVIAAFLATGTAVGGLHALLLLRGSRRDIHCPAVRIAFVFASAAAILQPLSGHFLAQGTAERQPGKFAALEALYKSTRYAPLVIGGLPSDEEERVRFGLEVPGGLSLLAHNSLSAEVAGLDRVPHHERPPVLPLHLAFQVMVGIGFLLAAVGVLGLLILRRNGEFGPSFLRVLAVLTPSGFLALEAGWIVTELGRQPWIIYKFMRTSDALTPMPGLAVPFAIFTLVYGLLTFMAVWLMKRQIRVLG